MLTKTYRIELVFVVFCPHAKKLKRLVDRRIGDDYRPDGNASIKERMSLNSHAAEEFSFDIGNATTPGEGAA